ncbi:predicted protein [Plenodomus lingam JN3]|uniref:Predicted protein n=1 Tax=Leptosphaeria maculans (strain JN3 / isolate v23.1.3 / race Av1-4-5-6-7-8) TaxID=985895 RepID=E4ZMI8_LEPMJ|nr:predicted protein [Plenodomus lingam JN3]CBX92857.1 predicted protein [Plenodomus lingam JN3]
MEACRRIRFPNPAHPRIRTGTDQKAIAAAWDIPLCRGWSKNQSKRKNQCEFYGIVHTPGMILHSPAEEQIGDLGASQLKSPFGTCLWRIAIALYLMNLDMPAFVPASTKRARGCWLSDGIYATIMQFATCRIGLLSVVAVSQKDAVSRIQTVYYANPGAWRTAMTLPSDDDTFRAMEAIRAGKKGFSFRKRLRKNTTTIV